MLGYFLIGPYVDIVLFENPPLPSISVASLGALVMIVTVWRPPWFPLMTVLFTAYACGVLYLTA